MLKKLSLLLAAVLSVGLLAGCSKNTKKDDMGTVYNEKYNDKSMSTVVGKEIKLPDNEAVVYSKTSGFCFVKPESWSQISNQDGIDEYNAEPELFMLMYMPKEQADLMKAINKDTMSKEEISKIKNAAYDSEFYVFGIYRVNEDDQMTQDDAKEVEGYFENKEKICTIGKDTFYFAYNDKAPETGFSGSDKEDVEKLTSTVKEVKDNIILFPPTDPMDDFKASMEDFKTTDLEGNEVTQEIFKDYDVTMVNVWATWCKYCVQEMPELEALYEKLPEKTNIVTICTDADTEEATAKELIKKTGAKFTTMKSCDQIKSNVLEYVSGYPTTFFVDKNGKVIGKLQIGTPAEEGKNTQAYLDLLNEVLKGTK